jgi:integrase
MITVAQLRDFSADFKGITPSTYRMWEVTSRRIAEQPVAAITEKVAGMYYSSALKDWKKSTLKTRLGYLGSMWNVGIERNVIPNYNPWSKMGKFLGYNKKIYAPKNFDAFLAFHRDPLFIGLWYHGFRVNELACLLPGDFVTDAEVPYINIAHNHIRGLKNIYSERMVPIHPKFQPFIKDWQYTDNPRAGDNFSRKLKTATGTSAHGLRHLFISRMRKAGVEYSIAMKIVGHKCDGQTGDYGDIDLEDISNELQKLR